MSDDLSAPVRTLHVITGLGAGGAEHSLLNLLERLDRQAFPSRVIALGPDGPSGERLRALGVPVQALGLNPRLPNPLAALRLAAQMRRFRPHVVQTWMYHANLLGGLAAKLAGSPPVVWGIHHALGDPAALKRATRAVVAAGGWLSAWAPARILCVAESSRRAHAALGYDESKLLVIPNGFDVQRFRPDPLSRARIRRALALDEELPLVGLCARYHPVKDHRTFLRAAEIIARSLPQARFALCGAGVSAENDELQGLVRAGGLEERCLLLGPRADMPALLAGLDLLVSSSRSEAFSNVIGEAMACGVPCVVTDTGDSALIVGESGRVVGPGDAPALARACLEVLCLPPAERAALGRAARERVEREYPLERVVRQYAELYRRLAQGTAR